MTKKTRKQKQEWWAANYGRNGSQKLRRLKYKRKYEPTYREHNRLRLSF